MNWASYLPNKVVQFLSVDEVLEIHAALIVRFGGAEGLRDKGLLESALYRPQSGYYADLVEMAAATGAKPVTTLKDYVRLPEEAKPMVETLSVTLEWADEFALDKLLSAL